MEDVEDVPLCSLCSFVTCKAMGRTGMPGVITRCGCCGWEVWTRMGTPSPPPCRHADHVGGPR